MYRALTVNYTVFLESLFFIIINKELMILKDNTTEILLDLNTAFIGIWLTDRSHTLISLLFLVFWIFKQFALYIQFNNIKLKLERVNFIVQLNCTRRLWFKRVPYPVHLIYVLEKVHFSYVFTLTSRVVSMVWPISDASKIKTTVVTYKWSRLLLGTIQCRWILVRISP